MNIPAIHIIVNIVATYGYTSPVMDTLWLLLFEIHQIGYESSFDMNSIDSLVLKVIYIFIYISSIFVIIGAVVVVIW